jgi:hypothetical protein
MSLAFHPQSTRERRVSASGRLDRRKAQSQTAGLASIAEEPARPEAGDGLGGGWWRGDAAAVAPGLEGGEIALVVRSPGPELCRGTQSWRRLASPKPRRTKYARNEPAGSSCLSCRSANLARSRLEVAVHRAHTDGLQLCRDGSGLKGCYGEHKSLTERCSTLHCIGSDISTAAGRRVLRGSLRIESQSNCSMQRGDQDDRGALAWPQHGAC